jgi:hypothetical protein
MKLFILKVFLAVFLITVLFSGSFLLAGVLEARQAAAAKAGSPAAPAVIQVQDNQSPAVSLDGSAVQPARLDSLIR